MSTVSRPSPSRRLPPSSSGCCPCRSSPRGIQGADGGHGKTLTALGSYWKGRKPLILSKACILGCLLPATEDLARDLEIFEKLMAMDDESFVVRWKRQPRPKESSLRCPLPASPTTSPWSQRGSCQTQRQWTGRSRNTPR